MAAPLRRNPRNQSLRLEAPFDPRQSGRATLGGGKNPQSSSNDTILAQLSFAPATTTTVVTTTTVTTTSFPPLKIKTPHELKYLDPKLYPLAITPTPPSIKCFAFDVDGRPALFHEPDNSQETLQNYYQEQDALQKADGVLRHVEKRGTSYATPPLSTTKTSGESAGRSTDLKPTSMKKHLERHTHAPTTQSARIAAMRKNRDGADRFKGTSGRIQRIGSSTNSRLQICQTSTPVTPHLGVKADGDDASVNSDDMSLNTDDLSITSDDAQSPSTLQLGPDSSLDQGLSLHPLQTLSPKPEDEGNEMFVQERGGLTENPSMGQFDISGTRVIPAASPILPPTTYPYVSRSNLQRPRPPVLDTTASQDMSLPSPSLSPVTAAANLQQRGSYFDSLTIGGAEDMAPLALPEDSLGADIHALVPMEPSLSNLETRLCGSSNGGIAELSLPRPTTLMDMPSMIDAFEAFPPELKQYYIYQLLRRCPKSTLHFIADVVNPTLKCDFLSLLPLELSQQVICNLDAQSLCRAAQVSNQWRQIVNSDEKTWKIRFDSDGFVLPEGELQKAILEGWGWQHASSENEDCEQDLGDLDLVATRHPASLGVPSSDNSSEMPKEITRQSQPNRRNKRKAASKGRVISRKLQKRDVLPGAKEARFDFDALMKHLSASEGPYAAANLAVAAVPNPKCGATNLQDMHLYKSLYRRHHLIKKYWMQENIKPKHIAFRAHQRSVVTCLQFDSDKILTGSDDTSISVYDTKTGKLRAKLEGHEGGVWALQYEGNLLVSGSTDRSVRVWDIEKGICLQVFHGHTSTVRCLQILMPSKIGISASGQATVMPKQPLIITGSRDSNLRIWKLPKMDDPRHISTGSSTDDTDCPFFVRALTGHHHSVRAIAAHGDTLVSGSYDFTVRVWKISTGDTLHRLQGHNQKVYSVVLDHERNRCISGSMDNLVKVWSLDTGTLLFNLEGHTSLVGLLDLQQNYLVSAAADSTLRVWDPVTGLCKNTLMAHRGAITCFQHDGQKVISGSEDTLKMWNINTGELERDLLTDLSGVWQVKFDGRRCVAAVQRDQLTYVEVLDFGAARDGVPANKRGKRIVVNANGLEVLDLNDLNDGREAVPETDPALEAP
ncbi:SCF ubiquitin ligase complex subunit cdc4 [Agyrium rufum]|nr:SCF ubiquitin ligase complex subunit cdc4 [Agyrium rufum]